MLIIDIIRSLEDVKLCSEIESPELEFKIPVQAFVFSKSICIFFILAIL